MAEETVLWEMSADGESVISALDEIDAGLQASTDAVTQFVASATDLTVFDDILTAIQELTASVSEGFTNMDAAIGGVDESIGAFSASVDGMDAALATANETIASLEGEVAALKEEVAGIPPEIDAISGAMEGLQAAAGPLMMIATAAGMAGGALFGMGIQAQTSFSLAQNMGGATAADMQNLQNKALQLGVGMKEAGDGMYYVASAGFTGKDAIAVLSDSIMAAKGSGASMTDEANALTSSLHAYKDGADQAGTFTDMMTKTIIQGKQQASDYASAIGPLAAIASRTGVSFAEMNSAEATMTQINPHVRQDAQQLGALLGAMGNNVDAVAASAHKMGLRFDENTYKSDNFAQRLEYLRTASHGNVTEFEKLVGGKNGLAAASEIMDYSTGKMKTYAGNLDAIGHSAGTTQRAFDASEQTVQGGLDHIMAAFSLFSLKVVEAIGPKLGPILNQIAGVITNVMNLVLNHTNDVMPILGGLATMLGVTLVGAVAAFIIPMLPVLGIITAIGAVVAGVIYVWQHWGDIMKQVNVVLQNPVIHQIVLAFQAMGNYLAATFMPVIKQLQATWQTQLLPSFQQLGGVIHQLMPVFQAIGILIGIVLVVAFGIIVGVITGVIRAFAALLGGIAQAIGGIVQIITGMVQIVSSLFKMVFDLIIGIATGNFSMLQQDFATFGAGVVNILKGMGNLIMGVFGGLFNAIGGLVGGFIDGIVGFFHHLADVLVGHSIIPDMIHAIISWFTHMGQNILNGLITFVANVIAYFEHLAASVKAKVNEAITFVRTTFTSLASNALTWGADLVKNLISGIQGQLGNLGNMAQNIAGTISKFIHFTKPDTGPLADIENFMPHMGDTLAKGMHDQVGKLSAASHTVAKAISTVAAPATVGIASGSSSTGASGSTSALATSLLAQMVTLLQQQQKGHGQTNASQPVSTGLGTVVTQYNSNTFSGISDINSIYQQLVTLSGRALENANRGGSGGLAV